MGTHLFLPTKGERDLLVMVVIPSAMASMLARCFLVCKRFHKLVWELKPYSKDLTLELDKDSNRFEV